MLPNIQLMNYHFHCNDKNFYNDFAKRIGYADAAVEIQDHFLAGRRKEAVDAVPDELVDRTALVGPKERIIERLQDWNKAASHGHDRKLVANWMTVELFGALNKSGETLAECKVTPESLGGLVELISDGTISGKIAKDVFAVMFETGRDAASIVEERGLKQVSDSGVIEALIDAVIAANEDKVAEYRAGKEKLFGFFVGQVMKQSGGQANPGMVNQILRTRLDG